MSGFEKINIPENGKKISIESSGLVVPDNPIIPFIQGDGIGPDIWKASQRVIDAAVRKAYDGSKGIHWMEIFAGEKAFEIYNEWLPDETIAAIREFTVAIKGPLTTPVGGGFRSLNVTLRQVLDLYACVRPVKYYDGVPSPLKNPERMNVVLFRENTEDVYSGIEWQQGSAEVEKVIGYLNSEMGSSIRQDSGIGIKPISVFGSKRLVRKALEFAVNSDRKSVTLVHKGNIMKFTEGAFRDWGYQLAREEFGNDVVSEDELWSRFSGAVPDGKIVIKDRIADSMFQQILTRTDEYDVIATTNLNGDYLSDACAAQVGGLGMAPGANIGDFIGLFEATHGTAPKYAGQDKVNPGSLILSGVMMLNYLGWNESGDLIEKAISKAIQRKQVTYDLERQIDGATLLSCSAFASAIIENMNDL